MIDDVRRRTRDTSRGGAGAPGVTSVAVLVRRRPGVLIAGRYRLLTHVGGDDAVDVEFWQARDTVLGRHVALTVLCDTGSSTGDTGDAAGALRAADMLDRAARWGRFEHIGCTRLLDVVRRGGGGADGLPADVYGVAVTDWVTGQGLAEAVSGEPLRTAAVLQMLAPLAEAAEAAHRQGLVLGCAHPQRVRITPWGEARVAFALPDPGMTPDDDVRGLGAILYALLTGLSGTEGDVARLAGLPPAPQDAHGMLISPDALRPGVPFEVSELALGALGAVPRGRVHTAAAVHTVISELLASESEEADAILPPQDDGAPLLPDEVWRPDAVAAPRADRIRKRKLSVGVVALFLGMFTAIGYAAVQLALFFGITMASPPRIVVNTSTPPVNAVSTSHLDHPTAAP
jgi:hypothetical protein